MTTDLVNYLVTCKNNGCGDMDKISSLKSFNMVELMNLGTEFLYNYFIDLNFPELLHHMTLHGHNLLVLDTDGNDFASYVCMAGNLDTIKILVEKEKIYVNQINKFGLNPHLNFACKNNNFNELNVSCGVMIFNYLLKKGAQVRDSNTEHFLKSVIHHNNYAFINLFIYNELNIDCKINDKKAIVIAACVSNVEFLKYFLRKASVSITDKKSMLRAAEHNKDKNVKIFLKKFFDRYNILFRK